MSGKADLKPMAANMVHKGKTFIPHILPVVVGTRVSFPNRDPFFHNAFSNYDGQIFDIGLHGPGTTKDLVFRRPGVVRVFCNIHPTMSAVILVLDTPYFAVSDAAGNFTIANVPAGEYRQRVFHERVAAADLKALEHLVTTSDENTALPPLSLSAAGYLETPHKNKLGKDYPAVIKDQYPGQEQ
jgi:plastocyanin